jgi:RHH-type rel operon transcriptional repressor/antitoxin RelB
MGQSTLVTVRVKPEIAARLEKLAASMDRSKSYLAAEAIEEYIDLHEWQIQAIEEGIAAADRGETVEFDAIKKKWRKMSEDSSH